MAAIVEAISISNALELVSLLWMEVTMACLASMVWFAVSGIVVSAKPKRSKKFESFEAEEQVKGRACLPVERLAPLQLAAKALPETLVGNIPANTAPHLLMAVDKAPNFDESMAELRTTGIERVVASSTETSGNAGGGGGLAGTRRMSWYEISMLDSDDDDFPLELFKQKEEKNVKVVPAEKEKKGETCKSQVKGKGGGSFRKSDAAPCQKRSFQRHLTNLDGPSSGAFAVTTANAGPDAAKHRALSGRIRFAKQSEVSFFSLPLGAAVPQEDALGPLEYRRPLETKVFDGPSGHKARRNPSSKTKALTNGCEDEVTTSTPWDRSVSETSLNGEDHIPEDVEDWEDWCDDIAELMAQQRSCSLWSPLV